MAFSGPSSGSKRRSSRDRRSRALMSEINVTPFVDVMLVLLIVFMVAAPLLVNGVPLELPKTEAGSVKMDTNPLTVSVDESGRFAINDKFYDSQEQLITHLKAQLHSKADLAKQRIFIRGSKDIAYQKILQLLAAVQKAGFTNVALASLPE